MYIATTTTHVDQFTPTWYLVDGSRGVVPLGGLEGAGGGKRVPGSVKQRVREGRKV